jgi:cation transport ATPase
MHLNSSRRAIYEEKSSFRLTSKLYTTAHDHQSCAACPSQAQEQMPDATKITHAHNHTHTHVRHIESKENTYTHREKRIPKTLSIYFFALLSIDQVIESMAHNSTHTHAHTNENQPSENLHRNPVVRSRRTAIWLSGTTTVARAVVDWTLKSKDATPIHSSHPTPSLVGSRS